MDGAEFIKAVEKQMRIIHSAEFLAKMRKNGTGNELCEMCAAQVFKGEMDKVTRRHTAEHVLREM